MPASHPDLRPAGKAFQSKLVPFYDLIQRLRKKHTPYPEIARRLHDEHGLQVAASTIFAFVKVRARRPGVFALPESPTPAGPVPTPPAVDADTPPTTAAAPTPPRKKYVFIPKPKAPNRFSEEDLQWNDPLA